MISINDVIHHITYHREQKQPTQTQKRNTHAKPRLNLLCVLCYHVQECSRATFNICGWNYVIIKKTGYFHIISTVSTVHTVNCTIVGAYHSAQCCVKYWTRHRLTLGASEQASPWSHGQRICRPDISHLSHSHTWNWKHFVLITQPHFERAYLHEKLITLN